MSTARRCTLVDFSETRAAMTPHTDIETRRVPTRVAELGFAVDLPRGWVLHEAPDETPDFEDPTAVMVLALLASPDERLVWSCVMRPAYGHGTLESWARYLMQHNGLRVREMGKGFLGAMPAMLGVAEQDGGDQPLRVRFAFAEDGQRLINVALMGPADAAPEISRVWGETVRSFDLSHPRGSSVSLTGASLRPSKGAVDFETAARAFADHALVDDASALAPWNSFYAAARVAGRGRAAKVVALDAPNKRATLAVGAILCQIDVPFGWHALDDGQSLLVHASGGGVRMRLAFIEGGSADAEKVLELLEKRARTDHPGPLAVTRVQHGSRLVLRIEGRREAGQPVLELHQLMPGPDAGRLLHVGVVTAPERAESVGKLVDLMLQSVVFGKFDFSLPEDHPASTGTEVPSTEPPWWAEAIKLEREGNLSDAEQLILHACDRVRGLLEVARLYRDRALRLARHGDTRGAAAASEQMERWAERHAATAVNQEQREALLYERTLTLMHD
jgi:hypothetical protein